MIDCGDTMPINEMHRFLHRFSPQKLTAMLYISRNALGKLQSVSKVAFAGCEDMDESHPEVLDFFNAKVPANGFGAADADFVRVIEDLIDTLIMKNVIRHTDLPAAAQKKLIERKGLRNRVTGALNLLGGDERIL
jgi:hypothetical protein